MYPICDLIDVKFSYDTKVYHSIQLCFERFHHTMWNLIWMSDTVFLKCPFLLQLKQTEFLAGQTFSPCILPQLEHLLPEVGVPLPLPAPGFGVD